MSNSDGNPTNIVDVYASCTVLDKQLLTVTNLINTLPEIGRDIYAAFGRVMNAESEPANIAACEEHGRLLARLDYLYTCLRDEQRSARADSRIVRKRLEESQMNCSTRFLFICSFKHFS